MKHSEHLLFTLPPKTEPTSLAGARNPHSALVFCYRSHRQRQEEQATSQLFWNGRPIDLGTDLYDHPHWMLNPAGDKLATAKAVHSHPGSSTSTRSLPLMHQVDIYHQGQNQPVKTYQVRLDVLYRLAWINDDDLAWYGWREPLRPRGENSHEWFINGEPAPDGFKFEVYFGGSVAVRYSNYYYWISAHGEIGEPISCNPEEDDESSIDIIPRARWSTRDFPHFESANSEDYLTRIVYGEKRSPWLNKNVASGMPGAELTVSPSKRYIAFSCQFMGPISTAVNKSLNNLFRHGGCGGCGCGGLLMWPIALLFNPCFGIGTFIMRSTERQQIHIWDLEASNNSDGSSIQTWPPCSQVQKLLFTDNDDLLAIEQVGRYQAATINGRRGPKWDKVEDLRWSKTAGISYLALRDDAVYRVFVEI